MKKLFAIIIIMTISVGAVSSQTPSGFFALPNHVIGRYINSSGVITDQQTADFHYNPDGTLSTFGFPSLNYNSRYTYSNNYLLNIDATYDIYEGHYHGTKDFTYNNGLLQTEYTQLIEYTYDNRDYNFTYYTYDDEENLIQKEDSTGIGERHYWLYEYENDGKTMIETYYAKYYGYYHIWSVCTYQYDDHHLLQEVVVEIIDNPYQNGEVTKQTYSYTENGKLSSEISQTLVDSIWVNTKIHNIIYDESGAISEQQDGVWSDELGNWEITNRAMHEFSWANMTYTISFYKKSGDSWTWDTFKKQKLFFEPELYWQQQEIVVFVNKATQLEFSMTVSSILDESEWYYEIENENGTITYQHLECVGDTLMTGGKRPKIIIRSNTQYDKDLITEVTHEYIYEENGKVYWWNKDLEEFTTLYDYATETGDEWEIKVGTESIWVHVDDVENFEYEGKTYRKLSVSDAGNVFSGDIVAGFGHMTSFFPERLMNRNANFTVNGLRCYWVEDALLYHNGDEDCDAIYNEIHDVDENGPSTGSGALTVYPNPANGVLFVRTHAMRPYEEYRITNLMGQTLLSGCINAENQQIDISALPVGMYFVSVGEQTVKFVVR